MPGIQVTVERGDYTMVFTNHSVRFFYQGKQWEHQEFGKWFTNQTLLNHCSGLKVSGWSRPIVSNIGE